MPVPFVAEATCLASSKAEASVSGEAAWPLDQLDHESRSVGTAAIDELFGSGSERLREIAGKGGGAFSERFGWIAWMRADWPAFHRVPGRLTRMINLGKASKI